MSNGTSEWPPLVRKISAAHAHKLSYVAKASEKKAEELRLLEVEKILKKISKLKDLEESFLAFSSLQLDGIAEGLPIVLPIRTKEDLSEFIIVLEASIDHELSVRKREREEEDSRLKNEKVILGEKIREDRANLLNWKGELDSLTEHLREIEDKGPLKRLFVPRRKNGQQFSNDPKTLSESVASLRYRLENLGLTIRSSESRARELDELLKRPFNSGDVGSPEARRAIDLGKQLLSSIPKRMEDKFETIPETVREEVADLAEKYEKLQAGSLDQNLVNRHVARQIRQAESDKRRLEVQRAEDLKERRTAQTYLRKHAEAEKVLAALKKELSKKDSEVARAQEKVDALERKQIAILDELWARHGRTSRLLRKPQVGSVEYVFVDSKDVFIRFPEHFPSLNRVLLQVDEKVTLLSRLKREQSGLLRKIDNASERVQQKKRYEALLKKPLPRGSTLDKRPKKVVTTWKHAEELARDFLVYLGFHDSQLTGGGADGGVDVTSSRAVGQVKMHSKGVGRPDVQGLVGVASVEKKTPVFFAMMYTSDAVKWAEQANVALFRFERSGEVGAVTQAASLLESDRKRW